MEEMRLLTVAQFAALWYGTDEPTKSQCNMVRRWCAEGRIRHAARIGRDWRINARKELEGCL